jgi:hypothetical protein
MKKASGIFLIVALTVLMAACGDSSISKTEDTANNSGNSLPENFVMLDTGEWPQNEYTANIPQPESGTLLHGWIDPDKEYCSLTLSGITQAESEQYVKALKEAGFTEVEKVSEEINGDYVSVGTLLTSGDTSVSISYTDDLFGMYIKIKNGQ